MRQRDQHRIGQAHCQPQQQVAAAHVPQGCQAPHQPGQRQARIARPEVGARHQHADAEDDHRHADHVRGDVAPVAVVAALHHQFVGGEWNRWRAWATLQRQRAAARRPRTLRMGVRAKID
jgi:hypothetical protein